MSIEGLSHVTLIARDIQRTAELLKQVLNAEQVYASGDSTFSLSREIFLLAGGVWIAIMEGRSLDQRSYNHIAFKIADAEFDTYRRRLADAGVEMREGRPRIAGEGRSLYFYDYDNHLFELHTATLEQRLAAYARR